MEIPKYVYESLEKSSKAFAKARKHEQIVRNWLSSKGLEDETTNDQWIDTIEYGNCQHEVFKDYLEKLK